MFEFIDRDSILHKLNPCVKLFVILAITILISCSLDPVLPLFTIAGSVIAMVCFGKISLKEVLSKLKLFIIIAFLYVFFMLLLKGIDNENNDIIFLIFSWKAADFNNIICLGLRVLAIILMSMTFVMTTNPTDLILSFILQLHVPYVHGYAGMAAYRFVPTFQDEARKIRLAQEIRGVDYTNGLINRLRSPFKLMVPMLSNAVRKGEKIAIAMESRGLGKSEKTFYKKTSVTKKDILFIIIVVVLYAVLISVIAYMGDANISAGFNFN